MNKKYFHIILLLSIFLTGCSLYEIEDYSMVAGIGIDYIDDQYIVTLEIYVENEGQTTNLTSEVVTGKGNIITQAFDDITLHINKYPFINHCSLIILSESVITNKFDETIDYLLHDVRVRSSSYIMVSYNQKVEDIFQKSQNIKKVISDEVITFFERKKDYVGIWNKCKFNNVLNNKLTSPSTIILPSIKYEDVCDINGTFLINNDNNVMHCTNEETFILQLFNNNVIQGLLSKNYNYAYMKKCKTDLQIKNNVLTITIIMKLLPYDYLQKAMQEQYINQIKVNLKEKIIKTFYEIVNKNFDPFSIYQYLYKKNYDEYEKNKANFYKYLQNLNIDVVLNLELLTSGLSEKRG